MKQLTTMVTFVALVALIGVARADEAAVPEPVGKLTPPAGWNVDVGRSAALELAVTSEDHFGGVPVHVSAQHLRAPAPGGILLVTEVATKSLPADPAAAASTELHGIRDSLGALGDTVVVAHWDVQASAADKVTEGKLEWSDASLGTTTIGRTLVFQSGGHLIRINAECILASDATALRGPCEAALATLAPLAPVSARDALVVAAQAPVAPPPPVADRPSGEIQPHTGPVMSERSAEVPTTIVIDVPPKKRDRRPFYVAGGLILIAAVYVMNRRGRQRAEAAAERKPESKVEDQPADEPKKDDPA